MTSPDAESRLIELIRERTAMPRSDVTLGIGDDGAVVSPGGADLVLATDTLVAGVHFPQETAAADVGWKSLAVNLSDLAAMGAEPAWALLSLVLPGADERWLAGFADGFAALAREHRVALVGGDTTRGDGPVITVQVAGTVPPGGALTRAGAQPGDYIYVTGTLGDAAAGLAVTQGRMDAGDHAAFLRDRLDRPVPRVAAGRVLAGFATAAIDLSDGLGVDLERLLAASGVGARVDLEALPVSEALSAHVEGGDRELFQLAGDDYELCFTLPPEREADLFERLAGVDCRATRVGEIVAAPGLAFLRGGRDAGSAAGGWHHFRETGDA